MTNAKLDQDLSGSRIGEYEVVKKIGSGGMGVVYEGRHPVIGKRVAVKVLLPQVSGDPEIVQRFLSEAQAVNEIRHRGIVDIFSFGQLEEGSHYFVMEYLEGIGLDRLVKTRGPIHPGKALGLIEEVLDALAAAHEHGIIHRDIKPSNIFLTDGGRGRHFIKVLDFGIAKLGALKGEATPQTRASVVLGTPDYMSPEQARGKAISPQTDLYAVGCVLFELITGARLFQGENGLQTMFMHAEQEPRLPSELIPDLPAGLDDLVLWPLAKLPQDRPKTADDFRIACERLRKTLPETPDLVLPTSRTTPDLGPSSSTPPPISARRKSGASSQETRVLGSTPPPPPPGGETRVTRPGSGKSQKLVEHSLASDSAPALTTVTPATPAPTVMQAPSPAPTMVQAPASGAQAAITDETSLPSGGVSLGKALVGFVLLLGLGIGGTLLLTRRSDDKPVVPVIVELPVQPPPADVKPPPTEVKPPPEPPVPPPVAPETAPVAAPVAPPVEVAKVDPPRPTSPQPRPAGISPDALKKRLLRLQKKLSALEAKTGEQDAVIRGLLKQASGDVASASTEAQRKDAWRFLDDIEKQLGQ